MNRDDLKYLAKARLKEAKVLLNNNLYDGAFYLSGYSVECALKACIAKNTNRYDFPNKKVVVESHTHDIIKLVKIAGLNLSLENELTNNNFAINWSIVKDWSEISRYEKKQELEARDLYNAINNRNHGILKWIKQHW
jgi:HEPN domain-containing protein